MARSLIAVAAVAALASFVSSAHADELPDDQMAPFQFSGAINADNVYIRSYAGEDQYPVLKLNNGAPVIVVGNRFDWLKVLPPPGTYCLVGKAWVEVRGDGSVGRVREEASSVVNVRIGSTLVPAFGKVVTQIRPGQDVKILGQQEEYFKIAPPVGTFAYVHKRFVNVVKQVSVVNDHGVLVVKGSAAGADNTTPKSDGGQLVILPKKNPDGVDPTTKPAGMAVAPVTPSTQPVADATGFDALEAKFNAASKTPIDQQPIGELTAAYQKIVDDKAAPEPTLRVANFRLANLALRKEAAETMKQTEAARKQRELAQVPLVAEASEISQRMTANESRRYTAVGTLRASALPQNGHTLYRLTDPATGRTVVYIDGGASVAAMDGQFVGVRGAVTDDATRQIKLIAPQAIEAVDPAELARGTVISGMVPPSLTATSDASR